MANHMDQIESGNDASNDRSYRGDGPGRIGVTCDDQPDLVAPIGVNERNHGSTGETPPLAGDMQGPKDPDSGSNKRPS